MGVPAIAHFAYRRPGNEGENKSDMYTYGGMIMFSPDMKILGMVMSAEISGWSIPVAKHSDDSGDSSGSGVVNVVLGVVLVVILVALGAFLAWYFLCAGRRGSKEEDSSSAEE